MIRKSRASASWSASCLAAAAIASPAPAQTYRDPSATVERRAADLVGRMTLPEKAAQMQNAAPAIPRLGVPAYDYWNEALHGVARAGEATVFPQAIGMAATWDADLVGAEGHVIGVEGRARYNQAQRVQNTDRYYGLTFWSPNINIFRDPRWGRGQETLGEDPYLTGTLATRFVRGVQGDDPAHPLAIATPKHFAVHSGPEPLRHGFDVDPSPRDFTETYLPAFRRAIVDGKAQSLMCAYNAVDGKPACASALLLTDILRRDWGFSGFVTSDCGAIEDITTGHHYTKTNVEGAALSVKAGTDTACAFQNEYLDLEKAVKAGLIGEGEIDVGLRRLFAARMRLGLFDPPSANRFAAIPFSENHSAAHRALSLKAARESIVLLKNDGVLPLAARARRIAVIGPGATSLVALEGNYNGTPTAPVLPLDGMVAAFGKDRVAYAQGSPFVEQVAVPVPRTAFAGGLKAEFFKGDALAGPAVATRTDRAIEFDWNAVAPVAGVDPNDFSVRWTGTITPPVAGDYRFRIDRHCDPADDAETYVVRIEGAPDYRLAVACGQNSAADKGFAVHFGDARPRRFSLEYGHKSPRYGAGVTLSWFAPVDALRDEAVRVAAQADVVVAFVGLNPFLEGEEMPLAVPGFAGGDRTDIALPKVQRDLITALAATGKPLVVVLQSGSAVTLGDEAGKARAIIEAWYGGEQGGQAIAEVLRGTVNPSGRLPVTFYASTGQLPPFKDYAMAGRTYRYFAGKPDYPFGHGLSYTRFAYDRATVATATLAAGGTETIGATVRNAGKVAGDEVVQLYLATTGRDGAPIRSLKGYRRVHLAPGAAQTVTFTLAPRELALADADGIMRVTPATYQAWIGGGQPDTGAPGMAASFRTTGTVALPR